MEKVTLKFDINAHIADISYTIKCSDNGATATIKFENITSSTISAIKFSAKGYNSFGELITVDGKDSFVLLIQDLSVESNHYSPDCVINLPDNNIRKLELSEYQICFVNGDIIQYQGECLREYVVDAYTDPEKDKVAALKDKFGIQFKYNPLQTPDGWVCGCGRFNLGDAQQCSCCGTQKQDLFKSIEPETLDNLVTTHENKVAESKRKTQTNAKRIIFVLSVLIVVGLAVFLGYKIVNHGKIVVGGTYYVTPKEVVTRFNEIAEENNTSLYCDIDSLTIGKNVLKFDIIKNGSDICELYFDSAGINKAKYTYIRMRGSNRAEWTTDVLPIDDLNQAFTVMVATLNPDFDYKSSADFIKNMTIQLPPYRPNGFSWDVNEASYSASLSSLNCKLEYKPYAYHDEAFSMFDEYYGIYFTTPQYQE